MFHVRRSWRVVLPALLVAAIGLAGDTEVEPWRHVLGWLEAERDRMAHDLELAHETLRNRARQAGATDLVERLTPSPPRPRPAGYGILPEISDDPPAASNPTRERSYSLKRLSTKYPADFRDAAVLAGRARAEPGLPLEPWVDEFERLQRRMRLLEEHLDYHAQWQVEVTRHRDWFANRNRIVDRVRRMVELERAGESPEQVEAIRGEVLLELAPFRKTRGLEVRRSPDGTRVLAVEVHTDIADATYLDRVHDAIDETYNRSEAARALSFRLDVQWKHVAPVELYPDGAPAIGHSIDAVEHVARFADGATVLTTGAASTHAWTGRAVVLGPNPISRRTLAHEFGHLLGFEDAYLRGYDGEPDGAFGVVLVEWIGLSEALMGHPRGGLVTDEMIRTLLSVYGDPADFGSARTRRVRSTD